MFIPFAFQGTKTDSNTNPITSGLVFGIEFGTGQSYPGTGTTITDVSSYGITGTISGTSWTSNRYMDFNGTTDNMIFSGTFAQLDLAAEFTLVAYYKPLSADLAYIADKSSNDIDTFSLVYGYGGAITRPWFANYYGMAGVPISNGELACVTFTKDANGITNNYKGYKNGVFQSQNSVDFSTPSNDTGVNWNGAGGLGGIIPMEIYNWYYYDRALTSTEVASVNTYVSSY